jgi:hypothetical protein
MSSLLLFVAALWLLTAVIHGLLGTREILRPVLASDVGSTAKRTSEVAWHIITWYFVVLSAACAWAATVPAIAAPFAYFSGASALGSAVLFVAFGLARFRGPWRMPQWALFLPIAALSFAAPHVSAFSLDGAATVARYAAAVVLVCIAALHAAWALGSPFPARSRQSLAQHVVGVELPGNVMPGRFATWVVAAGLLVLTACVLGLGFETSASIAWSLRAVAVAFIAVFTLRGVVGFFEVALRPAIRNTPYMKWSRAFYSPLSLLLAFLIAVGAQS